MLYTIRESKSQTENKIIFEHPFFRLIQDEYVSGNLQSDGNVNANGNINSYSQITSSKRLTTGKFLQINGTVSAGNPCVSNGLVGRDTSGKFYPT
ncbi:hypothetical protein EXT67_01885 [Pectobacterium atrosepticum]|uniref:hypothetical protein n=1 Tax=Pectobacterium atrosepticum TaxID=29471 RepID=UPI000F4D357E|nr:hypothetical protein [Pectobacterium atrosepticum]MCL6315126.1 hypothetical protein [Pectobacterium atrosepticum]MCL6320638.1 hypothetical protein [Pectobacterium atrosepticum]